VPVGKPPVDAAIPAAVADDVIDLLPVVDDVDQAFFLRRVEDPDGLLLGNGPAGSPLKGVIGGPVDLDADFHGFSALPIHDATGTGSDRQIPGLLDNLPDVLQGQDFGLGFNRGPHGDDPDRRLGQKRFDDPAEVRPFFVRVFLPETKKFRSGALPEDRTVVELGPF